MTISRLAANFGLRAPSGRFLLGIVCLVAAGGTSLCAGAQPAPAAEHYVIVIGEGSISVPPDYAQVRGGVTTKAKTVREATDANAKTMAAITAALMDAGIEQKDIQTSQFSVAPVYTAPEPRSEPKLSGYSVSNQVKATIRRIAKVGDILDRMVTAGATDIGGIAFRVADPSKAADQAREAAIADARRRAQVYAHASGLTLGPVAWITEDPEFAPSSPMAFKAGPVVRAAAGVPIASGEDTVTVRVVVGFDVAH